jgi:F0F1-type ATP synthase alpha subunit
MLEIKKEEITFSSPSEIDKLWVNIRANLGLESIYSGFQETGQIISVSDGVARVSDLLSIGERVKMGISKIDGMALSLEGNTVGIVIFGNEKD